MGFSFSSYACVTDRKKHTSIYRLFEVERDCPTSVSPKLEQQLKRHEIKPPIVNQQCIVYEFKCNLCDAGYVGYTRGHLHERVEGHTRKSSSIYKHYNLQHNSEMPERFIEQFHITAKCSGKFDCLVKNAVHSHA